MATMTRPGGALALLLLALSGAARAEDYTVYDDVQVPLSRHYRGQGAGGDVAQENLWPQGRVNYFVDTEGERALGEAEVQWIADAVSHWEANTCIRFTHCEAEDTCPKPYMRFQSHETACNSPVGVAHWNGGVNLINLGDFCGVGTTIHEIGHSLGLLHEQARVDRDQYIAVDSNEVRSGMMHNFRKGGRALGPYNFDSVMHYSNTAFQVGDKPTIRAPVPVGQRTGLSAGDVAAIHFLYNSCSADYEAPVCSASMEVGVTHRIPYGTSFKVQFNAQYSDDMTVSYAATTAPQFLMWWNPSQGVHVGKLGKADLTFDPTSYEAGRTYRIGARFAAADGTEATCSVTVEVVDAERVCNGLSANDENVCSGRGACTGDAAQPCVCDAGYAGTYCEGTSACPSDYSWTFDSDFEKVWWKWDFGSTQAIDTQFAAQGASWRLGAGSEQGSVGFMDLNEGTEAQRISYDLAVMDGAQIPVPEFRNAAGKTCFYMNIVNGRFHDDVQGGPGLRLNQFYRLEHVFDWNARTVTHYVDGVLAIEARPLDDACEGGIKRAVLWGNGWLDEFRVTCTDPVTPAPPTPPTPTPSTPTPPTPAPSTAIPPTSVPATPRPPTPAPPTPQPPTPSPPTASPPTPAPVPGACVDATLPSGGAWFMRSNEGYGCQYIEGRCAVFGGKVWANSDSGMTGLEACCTCGGGVVTPLEETDGAVALATTAPPTPAPSTVSPPTPAPSTVSPPTPTPPTPSPPTPAPSTVSPPTPAPSTVSPPTPTPPTPSPPTPAPSTAVPPTPVPSTSAPAQVAAGCLDFSGSPCNHCLASNKVCYSSFDAAQCGLFQWTYCG
eukprot:TRINITY_DN52_c0_g2_i1.p1 TRINITY_DN52_c0_g2~~TRINITY_DN52_c0_g2_i1.p1  ORF type:complete len:834 (+),score=193.61 TRINITY_DN52_c0_g2_i1:54-2555(+)